MLIINLKTGFALLALFLMFLFCFAFWIVEYGKKNLANEIIYENLYSVIQKMIDEKEVTIYCHDKIQLKIDQLKKLKWKNTEKTEVLIANFQKRFGKARIIKHLERA